MRKLVVDDDPIVGADVVALLKEWGYVADGPHATVENALTAIESFQPDAALVDIDLQNGQSSEVVALLLREKQIPFLCMTGFSSGSQSDYPAFAGVQNLEKPILPGTLYES